jgi:hypothetical protein
MLAALGFKLAFYWINDKSPTCVLKLRLITIIRFRENIYVFPRIYPTIHSMKPLVC